MAEGRRALVAEPWPCSLACTAEPAGWPQLDELQSLSGAAGGRKCGGLDVPNS